MVFDNVTEIIASQKNDYFEIDDLEEAKEEVDKEFFKNYIDDEVKKKT
jgi:hypothetical protein